MQPDQQPPQDQSQPQPNQADTNAQPSQPAPQQEPPQMVYVSRPHEPVAPHITEEVKAKHEESRRKYPSLNLSDGEYVVSAVRRHPIGLLPIFGIVGVVLLMLGAAIPVYDSIRSSSAGTPSTGVIAVIAFLLAALFVIGGYIAVYVYVNNKFFLTNESVVQEIQHSLFSKHEQTVSLANIEDASYQQSGLLPHIFNYGAIRLSTEGDETTYRFSYVANPKKEIATLNNAVEAFKNGRPIQGED